MERHVFFNQVIDLMSRFVAQTTDLSMYACTHYLRLIRSHL